MQESAERLVAAKRRHHEAMQAEARALENVRTSRGVDAEMLSDQPQGADASRMQSKLTFPPPEAYQPVPGMAAGNAAVPSSWRQRPGGQIAKDARATRVGQPWQRPTTSAKQQQWRGSVMRASPGRAGMQYDGRHGTTAGDLTRVPARGSTGTAAPRSRDAGAGGRSDQQVTQATGERLDANHQQRLQ